jgi:hypothetical protein
VSDLAQMLQAYPTLRQAILGAITRTHGAQTAQSAGHSRARRGLNRALRRPSAIRRSCPRATTTGRSASTKITRAIARRSRASTRSHSLTRVRPRRPHISGSRRRWSVRSTSCGLNRQQRTRSKAATSSGRTAASTS